MSSRTNGYLTYEAEARPLLLESDTLRVLIDLSNKPDEQIRRGCAAACD